MLLCLLRLACFSGVITLGFCFLALHSGLWRQLINVNTTFLETTVSSGYLTALIFGKLGGLLDTLSSFKWDGIIQNAWKGLEGVVDLDSGKISGACQGTGIESTIEEYEERSTEYCSCGDPGGPGFLIHAAVAYQKYLDAM